MWRNPSRESHHDSEEGMKKIDGVSRDNPDDEKEKRDDGGGEDEVRVNGKSI